MKIVNSKTTVDLVDVPLEQLEAVEKLLGKITIGTIKLALSEEEYLLEAKFFSDLTNKLHSYKKNPVG